MDHSLKRAGMDAQALDEEASPPKKRRTAHQEKRSSRGSIRSHAESEEEENEEEHRPSKRRKSFPSEKEGSAKAAVRSTPEGSHEGSARRACCKE